MPEGAARGRRGGGRARWRRGSAPAVSAQAASRPGGVRADHRGAAGELQRVHADARQPPEGVGQPVEADRGQDQRRRRRRRSGRAAASRRICAPGSPAISRTRPPAVSRPERGDAGDEAEVDGEGLAAAPASPRPRARRARRSPASSRATARASTAGSVGRERDDLEPGEGEEAERPPASAPRRARPIEPVRPSRRRAAAHRAGPGVDRPPEVAEEERRRGVRPTQTQRPDRQGSRFASGSRLPQEAERRPAPQSDQARRASSASPRRQQRAPREEPARARARQARRERGRRARSAPPPRRRRRCSARSAASG